MFVLNTGLIGAEAVDGPAALGGSKEFGGHRGVWEKEEEDNTLFANQRVVILSV